MLFSVALADKLGSSGLLSFSLYPGRVPTNIAQSVSQEELKKLGEYCHNSKSSKLSDLPITGWVDDEGKPIPNPTLR